MRARSRRLLVTTLWLSVSVAMTVLGQQKSGSITFNDNAPPPTEQQRAEAKRLLGVAEAARTRLEKLGNAQRASVVLEAALNKRTNSFIAGAASLAKISMWRGAAQSLGTSTPTTVTVNDQVLQGYTKLALDAADGVNTASPSSAGESVQTLKALVATTKELLFRAYDAAVIEHGSTNLYLRVYPNFQIIEGRQPFVECDAINAFARDVKCLPARSQGVQTNPSWLAATTVNLAEFCVTDKIEPFSRDEYGKKETFVRKGSPIAAKLGPQCQK